MSIESEYLSVTAEELDEIINDITKLKPAITKQRNDQDRLFTQCCDELHILLTGEVTPMEKLGRAELSGTLANAVAGGNLIDGSEEIDGPFLGRVRYLTAEQVKETVRELDTLTFEELAEQNAVEGIDEEDLAEEFAAFQSFYNLAAANDNAVLAFFTD